MVIFHSYVNVYQRVISDILECVTSPNIHLQTHIHDAGETQLLESQGSDGSNSCV
jgi:hypothetical protein